MTTIHPVDHGRFVRQVSTVIVAGASLLALAACSSTPQAAAQQPRSSSAAGGAGPAAVARTPGVSGLVAAWANNIMQVQSTSSQTAVTVTAATRITADQRTSAKAVTVGSCVTVRDATAQPVTGGSARPTTAPSAASTGPITAVTVQIRPAVNGSCGAFGGGAASGSFTPRARPSGAPSAFQGRGFGGQFRAFGATGQVASLTSTGFVVTEDRGGTTSSVSVLTGSSTTYTTVAAVTRSAVKTGECAVATGPSDSTGAVTATTLLLSQPVNGSCTVGFGFGGGGQRNG